MHYSASLPAVEKLKGQENWATWKFLIPVHLEQENLDDCIRTELSAEHLADPTCDEYRRDRRARARMVLSMESHLIRLITEAETAFAVWKTLCNAYESKGVHRRIALIHKLFDTKHTGSLEQYCLDIKNAVANLNSTKKPIDDETAATVALRNLSPEYKWLSQLVERTCTRVLPDGETTLTFNDVINDLFREAQKEAAEESQRPKVAMKTVNPAWRPHRGGPGGRRGGRAGGQGGLNREQLKHRHTQSQISSNAESNAAYPKKSFPSCRYCGKTNHPADRCWFKKGAARKRQTNEEDQHQQQPKQQKGDAAAGHSKGPNRWVLKVAKRPGDSTMGTDTKHLKVCATADGDAVSAQTYIDSGLPTQ